jgi:subtilisin family serine protease
MIRRRFAVVAAVSLTAGIVFPASSVGARQSDDPLGVDDDVAVSTTGSYIVVMDADPLVATYDVEELTSPPAEADEAEIVESHDEALEAVGADAGDKVQDFTNALNGFSAIISHDEALALAASKRVKLVVPDELRQLQTDSSGKFLGLTGRGGAWASGVTGEGVVVGVIDSGIWPEHPSFADDGSYTQPSILPLDESTYPACDFGNTAHNPNDAAFTCNNKLIGARQTMATYRALLGAEPDEFDSARDDDGHGTHTASTAAGNAGVEAEILGREVGTISGIAPRAYVIAYKGLGNLGGFGSDLAASIDQAVADGVDVINYSVGGGPSLTSPDDIAFLFAADAGVFVATSAGNGGPGEGTIGGPASVPWLTSVGASTQKRFFEAEVKLDTGRRRRGHRSHGEMEFEGASITPGTNGKLPLVDAEFAGGDLCVPGTLDPAAVGGKIVLCRRGEIARIEKSLAVFQAGGSGMILYENTDDNNLLTDSHWVPSIHVDNTPGLAIKAYIASSPNPRAEIEPWEKETWKNAPTMAYFSSRGADPVAEDIIKPDVTAPGVQIVAGNSPFPDPGNVQGELFQSIAGTSMSSPHVAGLFALIKQVHPGWTPAMAKSALMTSASQKVLDNDRVSPADPFGMGAGHVDPGRVRERGSMFEPGLVYDAGFFEYLGFLCDAEASALSPDTCPFLESIGVPIDASDLNLASIGIGELAGSQTVTRTVTSVADRRVRWRVNVDAPVGYHVTVSPSTMTLEPGEVASYDVTITNDGSGVIGEWSFGSLTWNGSGYDAYSPIAVKGALFDSPASVDGTGTSGTGSFDVNFGYTGDYSAAPHGLVPDAPVSGDISQDPDQAYTPGEVSPGVDLISFPVTGAALVRWSMAVPGADDIDLFLEDSAGNIIAASTNGGTDESIELVLPPDDTYTMVVHGWSVPNQPLPYTLNFWNVPAAPGGGSLSIDSAPASATIGTTGTIDYSWSGLTGGVEYLGAVSHSDAGGIIGLTLVEIAA